MTSSQMEETLRGALRALYCRHYADITTLTCYLERQLPLREPFYQLKRVPHFQVRDDLHQSDVPAYAPILRLESATPEDVAHRGKAGCRRILVEGDLGTGKTFLCYQLLQMWAQPRAGAHAAAVSAGPRMDDFSSFKMVIYVDCVRLAVSDFLSKCEANRKRHVHVVVCALLELLSPADGRLFVDRLYAWLQANQSEVCVIFDNVDASDSWLQLLEETLREAEGLGKIIVCATPGRLPKKNIDSLFYCYGLHPDYSYRLVLSKLKRLSADFVDRAAIPKALDSSQELLRNPLSQSLLATYLKRMEPARQPLTQFDFIEEIVGTAMVGDSFPLSQADHGLLTSSLGSAGSPPGTSGPAVRSPVGSPTSLMSICETVAFECLESNTNYFCKFKFPAYFWSKHLCDCRILHEIHDIAKQGRPVVSFTSRCLRDYLASRRVCRYLLSDRDSSRFLNALIHKRQFHSVVKFCIRQFVKLGRLDMVQLLLDRLVLADPRRWSRPQTSNGSLSRGRLNDQAQALSWLRETDFDDKLLAVVARRFPDVLQICYADCPQETLQDFVTVVERAAHQLTLQGVVIYMDGMFSSSQLGLGLARCLKTLTSLTSLTICLRCVMDTAFVVNFLCEVFEGNDHLRDLTLEGPFNSSENLTPVLHKRVRRVFSMPGVCSSGLSSSRSTRSLHRMPGCPQIIADDPLSEGTDRIMSGEKIPETLTAVGRTPSNYCGPSSETAPRVPLREGIEKIKTLVEDKTSEGMFCNRPLDNCNDDTEPSRKSTASSTSENTSKSSNLYLITRRSSPDDLSSSENGSIKSPEIPPSPWETPYPSIFESADHRGSRSPSSYQITCETDDDVILSTHTQKPKEKGSMMTDKNYNRPNHLWDLNIKPPAANRNSDSAWRLSRDATETWAGRECPPWTVKAASRDKQRLEESVSACETSGNKNTKHHREEPETGQSTKGENKACTQTPENTRTSQDNATLPSSHRSSEIRAFRWSPTKAEAAVSRDIAVSSCVPYDVSLSNITSSVGDQSQRDPNSETVKNERSGTLASAPKRPNLLTSLKSRPERATTGCGWRCSATEEGSKAEAPEDSCGVRAGTLTRPDRLCIDKVLLQPQNPATASTQRGGVDTSVVREPNCGGGGGSEPTSVVALRNLSLEHVNYHHRVAYLLSCWPDIFQKLEIRKSNINTAGTMLADKVRGCCLLHTLVLEHCHVTSTALQHLLQQLNDIASERRPGLKVLGMNLLSSARHFTRSDARKVTFRPSLSLRCCTTLASLIGRSVSLEELALRHDGLDDGSFRVIADAASRSASLTSLDLSGNVLGDGARDDVIALVTRARRLRTLYFHENSFSMDVRQNLADSFVDNDSIRLSL